MFHDVSLWSAAYGKRPSFCLLEVWLPSTMPRCRPSPPGGLQANKSLPMSPDLKETNDSNDYQSERISVVSNVDPFELHLDPPRLQPHSFTQVLDQTRCRGGWCHVTALVTERKWKKNVEKWTSMLRKKHTLQQYLLIYSTMSCQNKRKMVQV